MSTVTAQTPAREGWAHMPCELDRGPAARAAIGLIALATDMTIEPELQTFLPRDGVAVYANRIPMSNVGTVETLLAMREHIAETVSLILPYAELDVVAFGCTSGSMAIGPENVAAKVREARPGVACTDPVSAALKGLRALRIRRIALLTPYVDEVNAVVETYVQDAGFDIVARGSFKQPGDPQIVCVPPADIYRAGAELGASPDAQALFISCTGLRVSSIIAPLEEAIGKPVVTSNQALAWDCLRLAGCQDRVEGYGRLLAS